MIYTFACSKCGKHIPVSASIKVGPPDPFPHGDACPGMLTRVWELVQFICGGDPDYIKPEERVLDTTDRRSEYVKEGAFQKHIEERRSLVRQAGHNPNTMRMTHSVPSDLFHGKIRATGDKSYWDDPANLKKHTSCKVD